MKNIFILPTENPSRLLLDIVRRELLLQNKLDSNPYCFPIEKRNVYITNNENKKIGDYTYSPSSKEVLKIETKIDEAMAQHRHYLKIILTTDLELQKDGVQSIPDDFLEWYIAKANDSGKPIDIVNVINEKYILQHLFKPQEYKYRYKIIIPKESEIDENYLDSYGSTKSEFNLSMELKKKQSVKDRILSETSEERKQKVREIANRIVMGQELDCPFDFTSRCTMGRCNCKPKPKTLEETEFTYSEKELIEEAKKLWEQSHPNPIEMALFGAKWQKEKVENFCNDRIKEYILTKTKFIENNVKDWIEIPDYKISALKEVLNTCLGLEVNTKGLQNIIDYKLEKTNYHNTQLFSFTKWCLLHKSKGRPYDWENVERLYEIYIEECRDNPDMVLLLKKYYSEDEVLSLLENYDRELKLDTFAYTEPCKYTVIEWFKKFSKNK